MQRSGFQVVLSQLNQGQRQLLVGRRGRRLEGPVQPLPQVTMHEQLLAEQGQQVGQSPAEAGFQLQVAEH